MAEPSKGGRVPALSLSGHGIPTQDPPRTRSYRSPASAPVNSGQGAEPAVPAQASWSKDPSLARADLQDLRVVRADDRVVGGADHQPGELQELCRVDGSL